MTLFLLTTDDFAYEVAFNCAFTYSVNFTCAFAS